MEEQLRRLVERAEPKPKSLICVSGNTSRLKTSFIPPLEFPPSYRYEIALTSLETYYSFPNINASNNHVKMSFDDGESWLDIHIPVGCYEINAINNVLQRFIMQKTGDPEAEKRIILSPNSNTLRCVLEVLDDAKCRVDFNVGDDSLCTVLGFARKVYVEGRHESEHIINILSVNSILVHCDVIESSRLNGRQAPIIYTFFPDASPGDKIISVPRHLIYIPLTLNIISHMTCWVTDQNGKELDLQGEELTLTFHVKAC